MSAAVRIFEEVGLVEAGIDDDGRFVTFLPLRNKVDLAQSTRYVEGVAERENFQRFCGLVLNAQPDVLENVVNRPIYPASIPLTQ